MIVPAGLEIIWGARCELCGIICPDPAVSEADAIEALRMAHEDAHDAPGAIYFVCKPGWQTSEIKVTAPVGETRHFPFRHTVP